MLILNQKQVQRVVPLAKIKKIIDVVEKAFFEHGKGNVQMPAKSYLYFEKFNGDLRIMPAFSENLAMAGTKIVNVHPDNSKKGLKTVMAVIVLNNPKNGLPLSLMDGTYLTAMRTGAAGAVAVKYLAKKNAHTLGVVGAGEQAITQIAAITKVRNIKKVVVFDINKKAVSKLAAVLRKENIKIHSAELEEVARQEILVTVTPSRKPIIKKKWILPGTHINAIGADAAGKEELEPSIIKEAKVVIDEWSQASHSGEINVPLSKGFIKKGDIYCQLGEIVAGKKSGRKSDKEITVFDSTGLAIQDLYSADLVYKLAKKTKIGKEIKVI